MYFYSATLYSLCPPRDPIVKTTGICNYHTGSPDWPWVAPFWSSELSCHLMMILNMSRDTPTPGLALVTQQALANDHRTTEQPKLTKTSKGHLVQPSEEKGASMRWSSSLPNHILKTSSDGNSTMSLERLFQGMIILTVKNIFFILRWNLFSCNLPPSTLVLFVWLLYEEKASILFAASL